VLEGISKKEFGTKPLTGINTSRRNCWAL